ncbi:MAG: DUF87 domain-containing protein [Planctomycetaceae bacterium]|nr:DUF87 domain-containing protein [Planctomycetaceae bacterium]
MKLSLSKDLSLPADAVTQTFAILAKRGAGKSYTAAVIAEEMLQTGQPVVIIDPTGAHWGLRSSADGKKAGFPIVVLGGDHGDLPLEEHAGEVVAQSIVENRFPAIIDLSLFRKGQANRFMTAFLETLYRLNREALHIIVDEADTFAPQRVMGDEARLCGAMEDCCKKGRIRGLGLTLITQRPAVLNKNVLTQCESLFVLRMVHPKDIDAIREWVGVHADPTDLDHISDTLPSLPIGEAWFWSPGWLGQMRQVTIRKRKTFDSGATPKAGESRKTPKHLAAVDLQALGAKMQASVEAAKSNDPKELRKKIADLEKQLKAKDQPAVDPEALKRAKQEGAREAYREISRIFAEADAPLIRIAREADGLREKIDQGGQKLSGTKVAPLSTAAPTTNGHVSKQPQPKAAPRTAPPVSKTGANYAGNYSELRPAHRKILNALAWLATVGIYQPARNNVAAVAGVSPKSSSFANDVSRLSSLGLVTYPRSGSMAITDAGLEIADAPAEPLSISDLHASWRRSPALRPAHIRLLDAVINAHPSELSREELAGAAGVSPGSSSFANDVSRLSGLGLIRYPSPGRVAATELLFPEVLA